MSNRTHINNELQSIAPGLISIPAAMPYALPQNYFSGLASLALSSIKNRVEQEEPLSGFSKELPYTVPSDYFSQLPELILQRIHADFQIESNSDFWDIVPKTNPYSVPAGFFDHFPASVLQKIKQTGKPQEVPTGYFESLPDTILAKVRKLDADKELEDVAPLLITISKQPVQQVPDGYFEKLQPAFEAPQQVAPVVSIKKKNSWLKYAVAASIVFVLSFGAYSLFNTKTSNVPSVANQPSVNVIDQQLANLDATTIEDYLKTNNAVVQTSLPTSGIEELNNANLNELLQSFTDQQLKKHIEETPELPNLGRTQSHT